MYDTDRYDGLHLFKLSIAIKRGFDISETAFAISGILREEQM